MHCFLMNVSVCVFYLLLNTQNAKTLYFAFLFTILFYFIFKQIVDHKRLISVFHLQLFTLWSWLPVRITMYQPVLLYTTEEHGCSLTTFYVRVEQHEPTLMMIKTCNNEVTHILLFCLLKKNNH